MSDGRVQRSSPQIESILRSLHRIESSLLADSDLSKLHKESKAEDGATIFIPNWNHKHYLPRSIRSAISAVGHLKEAGFSAEILIIDDASRDGSQKFLRTIQMLYEEVPLNTVFLKRNLGLPRLRNLAMQMSRYRYVCTMDADNELVADNLPLFLRSIVETGAALVHGNLIDKQGERVIQLRTSEAASMLLTIGNRIDAFALVDARKLLRVGGYLSDPRLVYEDWEMVLHLIAEGEKVVFVPVVMGHYHRTPGSMFEETTEKWGPKAGAPSAEMVALIRRMYAQTGTREWDTIQVGHIYHPAVGYIG